MKYSKSLFIYSYVQHKIAENASTLWRLIETENAYIFLSGNAKNMPDNVRDAFVEDVFCKIGGLSKLDGKNMLQELENCDRMQVETW